MSQAITTRQTSQRKAIRQVLEQADGPLTPQEILQRASAGQARLGLATVYRNLNSMQEAGEIHAVHLPGDPTRFEPAAGKHHHHFRCGTCESVFIIEQPCPVQVLEGVTLPGGFQIEDHSLTFYGTCPSCQPDRNA